MICSRAKRIIQQVIDTRQRPRVWVRKTKFEKENGIMFTWKVGDEYHIWNFKVSFVLPFRSLCRHILKEPKNVEKCKQNWVPNNVYVYNLIVSTIGEGLLIYVTIWTLSHEIWIKLSNTYKRDTKQQRCSHMEEFFI